ncbi:MAG: LysE family transporter [Chloroflexi bacterium]|nr:LysE family transporter [Chloroflexota bacterium]
MEPQVWFVFGGSFLVALAGAATPGPLVAVVISQSLLRGSVAGPFITTGHVLLELFVVIVLSVGLGSLLQLPLVSVVVGILGGAVLLAMGYLMGRQATTAVPNFATVSTSAHDARGLIATGAIASLSNPYWFIWWITIGAAFLSFSLKLGALGWAAFFAGHIAADLAWYSFLAFLVASGRQLFSPRAYRGTLWACAAVLAFLGLWFLFWAGRQAIELG